MQPATIEATLTSAERARETAGLAGDWRRDFDAIPQNVTVYLLLKGNRVCRGWATRRFLNRVTCWTWDERFCFEPSTFDRRPGVVEPIGWCIGFEEAA